MQLETCEATAHVRIGWLRSVCNVYHAFGSNGFADELAYLAGGDPKDHLLKLIGPPRKINPADDGGEYTNYGQALDTHPVASVRLSTKSQIWRTGDESCRKGTAWVSPCIVPFSVM